jgi:hypothetical protein
VVETRLNEASGADLLVATTSNSGTAYAGCPPGLTPPVTAGMVVHLTPDHGSSGGATTFNYCSTSAVAFREADGVTNLTNTDLVAGRMYNVWYDGTIWRLLAGSGGGTSVVSYDNPAFVICTTTGCQPETTFNNYFISSPNGVTFDECGISLQTMPTVQSVIVDIQTVAGASIFGATKLVVPTSTPVGTTIFQATFANSPLTAAKGAQFKAVVTQSDTGGAALGGYVKCRVH